MFLYIIIFIASCIILSFSGKWLISSLCRIAEFLGWKEFVVAFFLMAFGASVPNLFIGLLSAFNGVPELSFGDVVGGNIIDLSLIIGLAALTSKAGLSAQSRTVQGSLIFTIIIAVLPVILISDQNLSRPDGVVLLLSFLTYTLWLFSKKERFTKTYDDLPGKIKVSVFLGSLARFLVSLILVILAAKGVVESAIYFSKSINIPLDLVGVLIVGVGSSLPEAFFSLHAAKKGQDWMVLGEIMGGVVMTATLVLGIVALICPITFVNFSPIAIGRLFMFLSAAFFLFCVRTGGKVTKKEAWLLIILYITFVLAELLYR